MTQQLKDIYRKNFSDYVLLFLYSWDMTNDFFPLYALCLFEAEPY